MTIALILFALAAVGGAVMAIQRVSGKTHPPLALALVHGAAAAAGLIALVVLVVGGSELGHAKLALVLFLAAALGGFALFANHLRKAALPIGLVLAHGLVAVVAFVILLVGALAA